MQCAGCRECPAALILSRCPSGGDVVLHCGGASLGKLANVEELPLVRGVAEDQQVQGVEELQLAAGTGGYLW